MTILYHTMIGGVKKMPGEFLVTIEYNLLYNEKNELTPAVICLNTCLFVR